MTSRFSLWLLACFLLVSTSDVIAQTAQTLPFMQNWTDIGQITANDDWSGVPGIVGFLGQDITTASNGTDPQTLLTSSAIANDIDVIANQNAPNANSSGGVAEFEITNPVVALQGSGTADAPHLIVRVNTTGQQNILVAYLLRDIDGSSDNSVQPVALQYRVGTTGAFTNLSAGFVADASSGPSLATLTTPVSVTLPAAANNQASVDIRIITTNASGSDEWIGVDDISVTGTAIPIPVTVTQTVQGGRGYRLLGAPVQGVTVGTLAGINLVQGVANQYPTAPDNVYLDYDGTGAATGYIGATSTANPLVPGRGFFWLLYDQDIIPNATSFGGGTSRSYTLATRPLSATGTPLSATTAVTFAAVSADNFYLIANPFARALSASAISVPGGLQGGLVSAYRPNPAGYVQIFQAPTGTQQGALATWQGVFAETVTAAAPTFTFDFTAAVPATPPFISRAAPTDALALTLAGMTAAGEETLDEAATVRFADGATAGWDALDASKLTPPAETYALVAPVGTRDGAVYRQGVLSRPTGDLADVTLAFTATHAGTYTLSAEATGLPASATLRDLATGTVASLADGYTFTSAATDWTDRFVVSFGRTTAGEGTASERSLTAPRPNPATARAALTLRLPAAEHVRATVVDALGRTVATLYDAEAPAGADVALDVDVARLSPGVYVVRVQGATFTETRRLTVVR